MPVITAGDPFPDLRFHTYSGRTLTVNEVVQSKKHTVFWVMRFIGCRSCQYDIDALAEAYNQFTDKDTQVFVVLQSSRDSINGLKGDFKVPFDIICDTDRIFYKELDVRATATKQDRMPTTPEGIARLQAKREAVAARHYERLTGEGEAQQLPALFIIGTNGQTEYAHYAVNSVDIPDFDELLQLVDTL